MRFKKIYIEITNKCNLSCSFCVPHKRAFRDMTISEFKTILEKIKPYTKYIYLHVKGEPLFHPNFTEICKTACEMGFKVNVTTNGTLISTKTDAFKYIRQLNISLHATNDREIIKEALKIKECFVNFRIWNNSIETLKILCEEMNLDIFEILEQKRTTTRKVETNFTLKDNYFISIQNEWEWPDVNSNNNSDGYCHALKDHLAILVDGTIVPCCLDNNGDINLGNVFNDNFEDVLNSKRVIQMMEGFKKRICTEELCKKCTYKLRF